MDTSEESAIKGKHIAITGSLLFYKRQEAFELIRGLGGIPQENVTRETDYLVVGHYRSFYRCCGFRHLRQVTEQVVNCRPLYRGRKRRMDILIIAILLWLLLGAAFVLGNF